MKDKLWVITSVFSPVVYQSRNVLYHQFKKRMEDAGINLFTVELAFGEKPFEVTSESNSNNLQLRTNSILWHKERLINLAVQRLPKECKYIAWIDSDLNFMNPNWAEEAVLKLQYYPVVQLFSQATDLSPENEILKTHLGLAYVYQNIKYGPQGNYCDDGHPGFAWAMTKEAFNNMGGLLDFSILGGGDRQMAFSFTGKLRSTLEENDKKNLIVMQSSTDGYKEKLIYYQEDAEKHIKGNVGYVSGCVMHYWHGSKKDRNYYNRAKILLKHQFDPKKHLKVDWQGLYKFDESAYAIEQDIYNYFLSRREDSR